MQRYRTQSRRRRSTTLERAIVALAFITIALAVILA